MLALPPVATGTPTLDVVHHCDALTLLRALPDACVNCVVTSPPYFGLRDYGVPGQIGLEPTPQQFVATMVALFREVRRVLRNDGTLWLNLGDSYASGNSPQVMQSNRNGVVPNPQRPNPGDMPSKNLLGIPWRVAFALQDDGWILRSDIIWAKPNPMPESVTDRPTKAHEYVFLFAKSARYWYDADAVREPHDGSSGWSKQRQKGVDTWNYTRNKSVATGNGLRHEHATFEHPAGRNRRSVWTVATEPTPFAHFATFPRKLIEPMILAGCPTNGVVLDPFMGSGTTALVAKSLRRHYIGCDLNADYVRIARERLAVPYTLPLPLPTPDAPRQLALEVR